MPKPILITGATSGFGEAMARRAAEGHRVIITSRRKGTTRYVAPGTC